MGKSLHIKLLSLLCLHAVVVVKPLPGIPPTSVPANTPSVRANYGSSAVSVQGNCSITANHGSHISIGGLGGIFGSEFTFKHAMFIGACVSCVAWIATTWNEPDIFPSKIKYFLRWICGQK